MLGGQTAEVTGKVNWKDWTDPVWEIELKGSLIPLVRKPGLIIRSDLDLRAVKSQGETALISGDVTFLKSYYLSDLRSLIPGRVSTARRRPPYFSVTEQPYADFRLDVRVQGDQGIRVRTPLFQGLVSADMRLGGTMEEPFTIGELDIDSGQVMFPFARMQINQGQVFMTSENPYRPQLFILGTSRTLGYEVKAQITGPVDDPVWEMSSSPPLSTEAIVLMLTAGEVPREDFSYSQSQRAGKLAMFLGRNLLSDLTTSESTEERLIIRSGESVTRDGQETYSVEYKLTDTLSVVGEYDRFGEVNAGLKWRIYSK
jgi:translocation and assembly module TamB